MGLRDKAILLVGFYGGGRRRDELSNLRLSDLALEQDGYQLTIRKSKTDQQGKGHTVPLSGETACAVKAWLLASGLRDGKLFRGIKPDDTLYPALSGTSINNMVKRRITIIGLDAT